MQGGGGRENGRAGVGIARWDRGEGREWARERGEEKLEHIYVCRMIPGEARMKMRRRMKCKRKERGRRRKGWRVYEI